MSLALNYSIVPSTNVLIINTHFIETTLALGGRITSFYIPFALSNLELFLNYFLPLLCMQESQIVLRYDLDISILLTSVAENADSLVEL
jgi:hypothetical protein